MKTIRKTIGWMVLIAAVLIGGAAWWGYNFWSRKNEFIRETILAEFAKSSPEWELKLATCRFNFMRQIHMTDLSLRRRVDTDSLMAVEECVVTIDRDRLFDDHEVEIQHIKLTRPTISLKQDANGKWSWEDFSSDKEGAGGAPPEIEITEGNVSLEFHHEGNSSGDPIELTGINLKLIPDGKKQFVIEAVTSLAEISSKLTLNGKWNIELQTGSINGEISGLTINDDFVQSISKHVPQLSDQLTLLRERVADKILKPTTSRASISLNGVATEIAARLQQTSVVAKETPPLIDPTNPGPIDRAVLAAELGGPALGLVAKSNVHFRLSRWKQDAAIETKVLLSLTGGTVTNPVLPYRLSNLNGKLYFDNRQILIRDLMAVDGKTRFELDGRLQIRNGTIAGQLDIEGNDVLCDDRVRSRLAPKITRVYDMHQPQGLFDASISVVNDGSGKWKPSKLVLTAKGVSGRNEIFPYPATDITGTIKLANGGFDFDLQGLAGSRPAWVVGHVPKPSPQARTVFDIRVNELPIDQMLLSSSDRIPGMKATLNAINLEGSADVHLRLTKLGMGEHRFHPQILATLKNCTLKYSKFPYTLTDLNGVVGASGTTWKFTKLKAKHGNAKLNGFGSFSKSNGKPVLQLTINADDVDLDRDLYQALPKSLQTTWLELGATGKANLTTKIAWSDPQPPVITLPKLDLFDASLQIRSFPYRISKIKTNLAYDNTGLLTIKQFSGRHRGTNILARGLGRFRDNGDWTVRLNSLNVENLFPDSDLRVALSDDLRAIVECLDPQRPLSLKGMLEFRGTTHPDLPVTAAWDFESTIEDGDIAVGVDLKDTSGLVTCRGTWDGETASVTGDLDLKQTTVLGYRIYEIRGPYRVNGNRIVIGNGNTLADPDDNSQPIVMDHVTGRAIGGIIKLDALAFMNDQPDYRVKLDLAHGKMERYAAEYMSNQKNLRGIMNGWIDLHGRGASTNAIVGRGQLQISPAALYELPVMAQIFGALHTGIPDATAFRYALLDFNVAKSNFLFNGIDLIGDSISLHSRGGRAGFDGKLDMDFYSRLPRAQVPIPLLDSFIGQATTGWVSVEVRGSTEKPVAKVKPAPLLNDALKQFLQAFEVRPPVQMPGASALPRLPTARKRRGASQN